MKRWMAKGLKILRDINYLERLASVALAVNIERMMKVERTNIYCHKFVFNSLLSLSLLPKSWLLRITTRHHATIILLLLLLLLRWDIEAVDVSLLIIHVKIIVLLIGVHVLMNVLMRGRRSDWRWWWLLHHHLTLPNVLIHGHAVHDLTTRCIEL